MNKVGLTLIGLVAMGGVVAGCASGSAPKSRSDIVETAPSCEDFAVQIYFESQSSQLTSEARSVLKGAEAMATGCKVASVRVVGLADAVGAPDANLALSQARADTVKRTLAKMGYGDAVIEGAAGDAGATTVSGENRPVRRRADVMFDLDGRLK